MVLNLLPRDGSWVSFGDLVRKAGDQHLSKPTLTKHLKQLVEYEELLTKRERGQKPAGRRGPAPWRFYRRNTKEPRTLSMKLLERHRTYWTYARGKAYTELRIFYLRFFVDAIEILLDATERSRTPKRLERLTEELADLRLRPKLREIARLWALRQDADEEIIGGLWENFLDELQETAKLWRRRYCPKWAQKYKELWAVDLAVSILTGESKQQIRRELEADLTQLREMTKELERLRPRAEAILAKKTRGNIQA